MSSKLNLLIAYPYLDAGTIRELVKNQDDIQLLIDSGAFTAWKAGKEISLDSYCGLLKSIPAKPWRYFTLDVIGDPKRTEENYYKMREKGLSPIPIFTRGDDPRQIDKYYESSDVIGIGGLVGTNGSSGFVKGAMKIIGDRKAHWLGFNKREFISYYKPYSCDSSSWSSGVRYAACKVYRGNGKWIQLGKINFITKPDQDVLSLIDEYEIDPKLLSIAGQWKNSGRGDCALETLNCRSWVRYQMDLQNKLGSMFHLAVACSWQVRLMVDAYSYWKSKK